MHARKELVDIACSTHIAPLSAQPKRAHFKQHIENVQSVSILDTIIKSGYSTGNPHRWVADDVVVLKGHMKVAPDQPLHSIRGVKTVEAIFTPHHSPLYKPRVDTLNADTARDLGLLSGITVFECALTSDIEHGIIGIATSAVKLVSRSLDTGQVSLGRSLTEPFKLRFADADYRHVFHKARDFDMPVCRGIASLTPLIRQTVDVQRLVSPSRSVSAANGKAYTQLDGFWLNHPLQADFDQPAVDLARLILECAKSGFFNWYRGSHRVVEWSESGVPEWELDDGRTQVTKDQEHAFELYIGQYGTGMVKGSVLGRVFASLLTMTAAHPGLANRWWNR